MRKTQLQGYDASVVWEVKEERKDGYENSVEPTGGRLRSLKPAQQLRRGRGPGGEKPERVLLLHTPPRQPPGSSRLRADLHRDLHHPWGTSQARLEDQGGGRLQVRRRRLRLRRVPRLRDLDPHRSHHRSLYTRGDRSPPSDGVRGF